MSVVFEGTFTQRIKITFEKPELFDEAFFKQFSDTIYPADRLDEIARHITHNYGYNLESTFIEGVGDLKEMGVKIREIDQESEAKELVD
jgi:hypothetical protein